MKCCSVKPEIQVKLESPLERNAVTGKADCNFWSQNFPCCGLLRATPSAGQGEPAAGMAAAAVRGTQQQWTMLNEAVFLLASAHLSPMHVISKIHQKQVKTPILHSLSWNFCFPPFFWVSTQQNQRKIHFLAQYKIQYTGKKGTKMVVDTFLCSYLCGTSLL